MPNEVKIVGTIDEIEIEFLLDQVNRFIEGLFQDMSNGFHIRAGGEIDKDLAYVFFRSKERMDNLKMLLQYLVYFVREVSVHNLSSEGLAKPYDQFKNFINTQVNVLLEDDVKNAIMREYVRILPLEEHNLENFEKRINNHHKKLNLLLHTAPAPTPDSFFKLFDSLRQFSRFWFELKDHQYRRIRRSDFFIYKFSRLLIEKYMH